MIGDARKRRAGVGSDLGRKLAKAIVGERFANIQLVDAGDEAVARIAREQEGIAARR
ncbi:hypothetical protein D3C83_286400 [compost metagenome]